MSFNPIDWLTETKHKAAIQRSVSIHPFRFDPDYHKRDTSKKATVSVVSRKLAAVSAHVERHPHSAPAQKHMQKLQKLLQSL